MVTGFEKAPVGILKSAEFIATLTAIKRDRSDDDNRPVPLWKV